MQNDLISRDSVYEYLTNKFNEFDISIENEFAGKILDALDEIPIAYDVEKVVAELEDEKKMWENAYDYNIGKEKARSYEHAIELVRNGGKE